MKRLKSYNEWRITQRILLDFIHNKILVDREGVGKVAVGIIVDSKIITSATVNKF